MNTENNSVNFFLQRDTRSAIFQCDLAGNGLKSVLSRLTSSTLCPGFEMQGILLRPEEIMKVLPANDGRGWSRDCQVLGVEGKEQCSACHQFQKLLKCWEEKMKTPLHKNTPLSSATKEQLITALKGERMSCNRMRKQVKQRLQKKDEMLSVSEQMNQALTEVMEKESDQASAFVKLFWEEQKKMSRRAASGIFLICLKYTYLIAFSFFQGIVGIQC